MAELDQAGQRYGELGADLSRRFLTGSWGAPTGFDGCIAGLIGQARRDALRSGQEEVSGRDNSMALVCLFRLDVPLKALLFSLFGEVTVKQVSSTYKVAPGNTTGFFKTGQDADILLSGFDFNTTGGPLIFNHPGGIASDGTRLFLSDTFNNRVLVWNTLATGNVPPDLVLGQKDFTTNNPGWGRDQMNWPVSIATDGKRLLVADTNNDRILIWNGIPTRNAQAADLVLQGGDYDLPPEVSKEVSKSLFFWPWGVWTNGEKLVITSTRGGGVLIWNTFPTRDNQPADLLLTGGGKMGTPRHVTSDGKSLIVGDHNARVEGQAEGGSFFWQSFPTTDDQSYDFYLTYNTGWLRGTFTPDGKLILIAGTLRIWNSLPKDASQPPDLSLGAPPCWGSGDYERVAVGGSKLYISCGNGNKVVGYNSIPTKADQAPDFAIGSPDLATNTLDTNYIIQNGVPASNGKSLFVISGFDHRLYVWKNLPDQSGAHPDIVYSFLYEARGIALWKENLALAGDRVVQIWKELPVTGKLPDVTFLNEIGGVPIKDLQGVAMDDKHFYLSSSVANKVYVWKGIPSEDSAPAFTLDVEEPYQLSSDGIYLTVAQSFKNTALVYPVDGLSAATKPVAIGGVGKHNGVPAAGAAGDHFFLVDGGFNRIFIWRNVQDALAGKEADVVLGANWHRYRPEIGRNTLFWPHAFFFDGSYLWVGEVKFSTRILRFSPAP